MLKEFIKLLLILRYEMASMNEARKDFCMVTHGNRIYAIAGQDENMVMNRYVTRENITKKKK